MAELCEGPQQVEGLPAGFSPVYAISNSVVKSIVDRYLGVNKTAACDKDDRMSVSNAPIRSKRSRRGSDSSGDADSEIRPVKTSKILRSRRIGSDSDIDSGPIKISDSQDEPRRIQGRKKSNKSKVSSKFKFSACPGQLTCEDLANKNAEDMASMAYNWLDDMELGRSKSNNLNNVISGYIKDRTSSASVHWSNLL